MYSSNLIANPNPSTTNNINNNHLLRSIHSIKKNNSMHLFDLLMKKNINNWKNNIFKMISAFSYLSSALLHLIVD